jgi:hypothetical protein
MHPISDSRLGDSKQHDGLRQTTGGWLSCMGILILFAEVISDIKILTHHHPAGQGTYSLQRTPTGICAPLIPTPSSNKIFYPRSLSESTTSSQQSIGPGQVHVGEGVGGSIGGLVEVGVVGGLVGGLGSVLIVFV